MCCKCKTILHHIVTLNDSRHFPTSDFLDILYNYVLVRIMIHYYVFLANSDTKLNDIYLSVL